MIDNENQLQFGNTFEQEKVKKIEGVIMDRPSTPSRMGLASAMPGTARPGSAYRGMTGFQTAKQHLPPTTASSGATSGVGIGVALDTQVQVRSRLDRSIFLKS